MKRSQLFIIIVLSVVLLQVFAGCMTAISPREYSQHYQDQAELIMADSSRYKLASDWRVDSNYYICGRGMHIKKDSSNVSDVRVPLSNIKRFVVEDNITPIYFEIIIASAVFISLL